MRNVDPECTCEGRSVIDRQTDRQTDAGAHTTRALPTYLPPPPAPLHHTPPNLHFLSTPPSPAPATAPRARAPAETSRCASLVCVYQKPIQDRRIHARASGHKNTSTFFYLVGLRGSRARASRLATTAPPPPHHMRAQSQQGGVEGVTV